MTFFWIDDCEYDFLCSKFRPLATTFLNCKFVNKKFFSSSLLISLWLCEECERDLFLLKIGTTHINVDVEHGTLIKFSSVRSPHKVHHLPSFANSTSFICGWEGGKISNLHVYLQRSILVVWERCKYVSGLFWAEKTPQNTFRAFWANP